MYPNLEVALVNLMEIEQIVFERLKALGIPEELWDYYMAFAKRVAALGLRFWDTTFQAELELLILEFKLRGLDEAVLRDIANSLIPWIKTKRGLALIGVEILFQDDWETGDCSKWDGAELLGDSGVVTDDVYQGVYSLKLGGDAWYKSNLYKFYNGWENGKTYFNSLYVKVKTLNLINPPSGYYRELITGWQDYLGWDPWSFAYHYIGLIAFKQPTMGWCTWALLLRDWETGYVEFVNSGVDVDLGTWLKFDLYMYAATDGYVQLFLNDAKIAEKTGLNTSHYISKFQGLSLTSSTNCGGTGMVTRSYRHDNFKFGYVK
jgi:hypothetical protein